MTYNHLTGEKTDSSGVRSERKQMSKAASLLSENRTYWTGRASGYSQVNQTELSTNQRQKWKNSLQRELQRVQAGNKGERLRVLEVGTGPGFFAIILCELGYDVTAVDLTPAMLEEARKNAGALVERIRFEEMNGEDLQYADESFDAVVSRNLTWNLPHPELAYAEWTRVLKPGGVILNYDANWYAYLYDDRAQAAFDRDRENSARMGVRDENIGENFDVMEEIARQMPLSNIRRPNWDLELLKSLGLFTSTDEDVWEQVWSAEEKLNFASTPLFLVRARKPVEE